MMNSFHPNQFASQPRTNTNLQIIDNDYFVSIKHFPNTCKFQKSSSKTPYIEEMFKCPLCSKALVDPVTDPCGHSFCGECILEARKKLNKCPVSFEFYETEEEFPVNILMESILQAELPCTNSFIGCKWIGSRGKMKEHVEEKCEYASFQCENENCKKIFQRKEIAKHLKECVNNMIMCKECGWSGSLKETEGHSLKCPEKKVKCPLECGNDIKRKDLQKHCRECSNKRINELEKEMNSIRQDKIDSIAEEIYKKDFANLQYKNNKQAKEKPNPQNKAKVTVSEAGEKTNNNNAEGEENWENILMFDFQNDGNLNQKNEEEEWKLDLFEDDDEIRKI